MAGSLFLGGWWLDFTQSEDEVGVETLGSVQHLARDKRLIMMFIYGAFT